MPKKPKYEPDYLAYVLGIIGAYLAKGIPPEDILIHLTGHFNGNASLFATQRYFDEQMDIFEREGTPPADWVPKQRAVIFDMAELMIKARELTKRTETPKI